MSDLMRNDSPPSDDRSGIPADRGQGYIDDPDGAKSAALGDALKELLQEGIHKKRITIRDLLAPHVAALAALKKQGATYAQIAASLSDKMGFPISVSAVSAVLSKHNKRRRKRVDKAPTPPVES